MDRIRDFILNGRQVANPAYNPKTKKGAKEPPFVTSNQVDPNTDFTEDLNSLVNNNRYSLTYLGDPEKYSKYDVTINPINSEEELNLERANNQSFIEQTGRAIGQAIGNEIILGTALGLSNIVDFIANIGKEKGEDDYTNPVSQQIESWQNAIRERLEIYQTNPGDSWQIGDFGWWANNAVSIASTASMLIPTFAVSKGLGLVGKGLNVLSKGRAAKLTYNVAKGFNKITKTGLSNARLAQSIGNTAQIGFNAIVSRTIEGYLEARGVYNEVRDNVFNEVSSMNETEKQEFFKNNPNLIGKSDDEIADYIASVSADKTFANDYAMLLMDFAQFKAIGSLWKGVAKKTPTASLRTANKEAIDKLVNKTISENTEKGIKNSFIKNRINNIKEIGKHPLTTVGAIEWSEGIEEGYQGIMTEKGKEVAELMLNPNYTPRSLSSYLSDGHIWEQAFWGVLGGMGFQAAGTALGNLQRRVAANIGKDKSKLSDSDVTKYMTAEEKIRHSEIKHRKSLNNAFIDKMNILSSNKDPDKVLRDKQGKKVFIDGVLQYETLTPDETAIKKEQLVRSYITEMVINAADAGNFDLLMDYITSPELNQHFKDAGVNLGIGEKSFEQNIKNIAESVYNNYTENLYKVLSTTDVENDSVVRGVAHQLTREQLELDAFIEKSNEIQNQINTLDNTDGLAVSAYKKTTLLDKVKKINKELDDAINDVYEERKQNRISVQAEQEYIRIFENRRKSLAKLLRDNGILDSRYDDFYNKIIKNAIDNLSNELELIANDNYPTYNADDTIPNNIKQLVQEQLDVEENIAFYQQKQPKSQEDYNRLIDDFSRDMDAYTMLKFNKAANDVEQYIIKQDNLEQAIADVMQNRVPELKDALNILKLGFYSTQDLYDSIKATVAEEKRKRTKAENDRKKVVVDGKKVNEEKATELNDEFDKIITDTNEKNNSSSTGEEIKDNSVKDDKSDPTKAVIVEKPKDDIISEDAAKAIAELDKEAAKQYSLDDEFTLSYSVARKANIEDPQLFEPLFNINTDIRDSEEFKAIEDYFRKRFEDLGVSNAIIDNFIHRAIEMSVNIRTRGTKRTTEEKKKFAELAAKLSTKTDIRNSIVEEIKDNEIDSIVKEFLNEYVKLKGIKPVNEQQTVINLERLFNYILNDINVTEEEALYLLYNISSSLNNSTDFIFTHKDSLNNIIKNAESWIGQMKSFKRDNPVEEHHVHISAPTKKSTTYEKTIAEMNSKSIIDVTYGKRKDGSTSPNSISFKYNGVEIGFVAAVTPNVTNTGFAKIKTKNPGINFEVKQINGNYVSNLDELIEAIINQDGELWKLINQYFNMVNGGSSKFTREDAIKLLSHPAYINAIQKGVFNIPEDKLNKAVPEAQWVLGQLTGIIFYNQHSEIEAEYREDYNNWKTNLYNNYKTTYQLQTRLQNNEEVQVRYDGFSAGTNRDDSKIQTVISDTETDINQFGFNAKDNPVVAVMADNGQISMMYENGEPLVNQSPFSVGKMGMKIMGVDKKPILALFTRGNRPQGYIKDNLRQEIINIITDFQEKKVNFDKTAKRLQDLFNGPGVGMPTIFKGYSVLTSTNTVALSIPKDKSDKNTYTLVIYRNRKDKDQEGTGVVYMPNEDINNAKTFSKPNKKILEQIANEILNNIEYNKTFYAFDNRAKDNTDDNQYMFKKDGKFVIKLNGVETAYDNFGDFVLKENAFKTNQAIANGKPVFDNLGGIKSLYVDVNVSQFEINEHQSVYKTITSASTTIFNNTVDLLRKAAIPQDQIDFLTGNNVYGISLVSDNYGYDNNFHQNGYYKDGKVYLGRKGVERGQRDANYLRRILIHEQLHHLFNTNNLFDKGQRVTDLIETYNEFIKVIDDIIATGQLHENYAEALKLKTWVENNKFTINDYQGYPTDITDKQKEEIFAEEWLVESLTQPELINFLNKVKFSPKRSVKVDNIKEENKTIFQKIVDILLELFGIGSNNIKNNTIFARQYQLLGKPIKRAKSSKKGQKTKDSNPIKQAPGEIEQTQDDIKSIDEELDNEIALEGSSNTSRTTNEVNETPSVEEEDLPDFDDTFYSIVDSIENTYNDGNATVNPFGITTINNISNYIQSFPRIVQSDIKRMIDNNELVWACNK